MEIIKFFKDLEPILPFSQFVALDFETTGLDPIKDRITEIGAIKFNLSTGKGETFSMLVDPLMSISPQASNVSGITNAMVKGKKPCDDAVRDLYAFLDSSIIVAHNANFDLGFLKAANKRNAYPPLKKGAVCTKILAKEAFPNFASYGLQNLLKTFSINAGNAHRALDDANACMELFLVCVKKLQEK